ncbi:dihydropteroate synthase [Hymenobacter busanensis]|uniref:dihydropteroate synthase n=1 Tax=Hymenobacter busanensis TaxID=2607656 RepID=A0A7L4ZY03_9BACT|nr:dihydropteroate synthase [Hymenobacter busanensis]KAA9333205.1 dihydropteroate synthase [Hymenobacter busanensis]QHJ08118.1 dihydropteroate synthase [Hymenobacter busanensis]
MLGEAAQDTLFQVRQTLRCARGRMLDLSQPRVMGILNVTPDSFFAGSRLPDESALLRQAEQMLQAGAAVLDVGGYSSRPGADDVPADEELRRVVPALEALRRTFPEAFLSVDTFRAAVAEQAVQAGADIVNDISGGQLDEAMFATVARLRVPYILMHMRGTPQTMTQHTTYEGDLLLELTRFFRDQLTALRALWPDACVVLDPGVGFAKTPQQGYEIIRRLSELRTVLDLPLLVGLSRKTLVWKPLGLAPEAALPGTIALNTLALLGGARLLRVHDVAEAHQTVQLVQSVLSS